MSDKNCSYIKLDSVFPATLHGSGMRCEICPPVGKEFLGPQCSQSVVASIADAIVFANPHNGVIHMQSILKMT